jgi:transposase
MGTQKQYDQAFKLHLVQEALLPENKHNLKLIAEKYGINPSTLSHWRNLYLEYGEAGLDVKTLRSLKEQHTKDLEKENAELKEEIAILKKAAAFLAEVGRK